MEEERALFLLGEISAHRVPLLPPDGRGSQVLGGAQDYE